MLMTLMEHVLTSVKQYRIFTGMHKLNTNAIVVRRGTCMLLALTSMEVEDTEDVEDMVVEAEVVLVTIL
jgi:hypothetical protein